VAADRAEPGHDLVVVGGSAGGVEALRQLVHELPADLAATVLIVLHLPRGGGGAGMLPAILGRHSTLPVRAARDGEPLVPGTVLVAPPDRHLLVDDGHVVLASGPTENGCRPAIDPLFRSAASSHRGRVVGVVLTGNLDDGSAGLLSVVRHGGEAVVQDPADALFPGMPTSALGSVPRARVVPLDGVAALVSELVRTPAPASVPLAPELQALERGEIALSRGRSAGPHTEAHPGTPSAWSCPDCSGVLWELQDGPLLRFRCRTGHAWSVESLVEEQDSGVDTALWIALRALEERYALAVRVSERAERAGRTWSAQHFRARAEETRGHVALLRRLLVGDGVEPPAAPRPAAGQQ
jgi:two-component system chemotaxis response regulator CheB